MKGKESERLEKKSKPRDKTLEAICLANRKWTNENKMGGNRS